MLTVIDDLVPDNSTNLSDNAQEWHTSSHIYPSTMGSVKNKQGIVETIDKEDEETKNPSEDNSINATETVQVDNTTISYHLERKIW